MWPAVDVNQFHPDREQPEFADVRSIWAHKGYHGVTVEEVCNLWGRKKWRGGGDPTFEKDVAALHIISRVMKTGWVSSPADSLVANEDFKRLLEDLRCHIESRGTLADVSIGIISKLLVTLVLGMGRNLHNIHSTETETAMLSLTTPLLLTIDGALDERDVDRIVREGHEDHLGSLALALSQAQDPHKVIHPNINLPGLNRAWKRFRVHARTTEFAKALYEKCKYTNSFKSSITIAHALAGTGIDSTFRNPRGHFYNPSNARYAKVLVQGIGPIVHSATSANSGYQIINTLKFFVHQRCTAESVEKMFQQKYKHLGVRAKSQSAVMFASAFAFLGWGPDTREFFSELLGHRKLRKKDSFGLIARDEYGYDEFFPNVDPDLKGWYETQLIWAMTMLGVVDDEEFKDAVEFLWKSHLKTRSLQNDGNDESIDFYTSTFERIYSVEGKNEYILNNLPTLPHPSKISIKPLFEETGEGGGYETDTMPLNEKITGLLSFKPSPEYAEHMKKVGDEGTLRLSGSDRIRREGVESISTVLDSLGFEHHKDFNPRIEMSHRRGVVVETIVAWDGIDIVHESSKKIAIRWVSKKEALRDPVLNRWVTTGYFKAQNRILKSEGFDVVEIFHVEWEKKKKLEDRKELLIKRLREQAGLDLDWIGGRVMRMLRGGK